MKKYIGHGMDRAVFSHNGVAVKRIHPNHSVRQNKNEWDLFDKYGHLGIFARVLYRNADFSTIKMELASAITEEEFAELTGTNFAEFSKMLLSHEMEKFQTDNDFLKKVMEFIQDYYFSDLSKITSYGRINDKIVIVDYGRLIRRVPKEIMLQRMMGHAKTAPPMQLL